MKKFSVFSGSRSEYGLIRNLLRKFNNSKTINLDLIISGSHLIKKFGKTIKEIKNDKIKISKKIEFKHVNKLIDSKSISENAAHLILNLSRHFIKKKPDALIVLGDRYETFIASVAAVLSKVKIIHIHGGEITFGSKDDLFRHSISKMSNYHFVSTEFYKKRLIQLGEDQKSIYKVGALCNDNIKKLKIIKLDLLKKKLQTNFYKKNILVSIHPSTISKKKNIKEVNEIFKSISKFNDTKFFFSAPNFDENSEYILKKIKSFCKKNDNSYFRKSFGQELYLNLMKKCDLLIGNSSSGIIESPLLGTYSINIGERQKGRVKSEFTFDCKNDHKKISFLIRKILNKKKKKLNLHKNPYYGKNVSNNIYNKLQQINLSNLNHKYFRDIKFI